MHSNQSTVTAAAKGLFRMLAVCIPVLMLLSVAQGVAQGVAQDVPQDRSGVPGQPSDGAKDMPGALGTIPFRPDDWQPGRTTYWRDTDGIDPGSPGCHIGIFAPTGGNPSTLPNGRQFGEACESPQILIESNPGAGVIHSHSNDIGYPDRFDCAQWCRGARQATGGVCTPVPAPLPCRPGLQSAVCRCNPN